MTWLYRLTELCMAGVDTINKSSGAEPGTPQNETMLAASIKYVEFNACRHSKKHGHLKHSSYHNAWRRLKADYPWLDAYFCFYDTHSIRPVWRVPPARPATTATMQIRAFVVRMPDTVLLIQWGIEYLLVVETDKGLCTARVNAVAVQGIMQSLLSSGVKVALIRQSTTRTTRMYDRYVHRVYLTRGAAAVATFDVSPLIARQLRLF